MFHPLHDAGMHTILYFSSTFLFFHHLGLKRKTYLNVYRPISHHMRTFDIVMRAIAVTWINLYYLLFLDIIFKDTITTNIGTCFIRFIFYLFITKRRFYYASWMSISEWLIMLRINMTNCLKNFRKTGILFNLNKLFLDVWLFIPLL